jgi:ribonuclease P/MRP protein subunit RPP1
MYDAVYAHPDGDTTPARYLRTASRYGYDGVVVRVVKAAPDYDALGERFATDVVDAVELVADDPEGVSGGLSRARREHTLVLVRGGTDRLNRFAVEQDRVDVLTRPLDGDGDFNQVLARAAREHGVHVEFDLGPVLRSNGGPRVQYLQRLRRLRELVEQYDVPAVVSATPRSHLQLRAPRELRAVGAEVGFDPDQITAGLAAWGRLAERNRRRASESFIEPGVERGPYEEER